MRNSGPTSGKVHGAPERVRNRMPGLWRGWLVQKRVLGALFMREIQIRWGRRNLGFAWIIAEPLVFSFPVILMWSYLRPPHEHGLPMIPFVWSGYLPLLMFRHTTGNAIYVIRQNASLLYHRAVTPLDVVLGKCVLELVGALIALAVSFIVYYIFDQVQWPQNVSLFLVGIMYMAWWSIAVALLVAAASERTDMVEHIWPPISYMYLPISGFLFFADWLPTAIRNVALTVMPSLHSYEMIRAGLLGNQIPTHYSIPYVSFVLVGLTLIGLSLMRGVRKHLEIEF
jgi:capsular polysaccharide transport system permease protein